MPFSPLSTPDSQRSPDVIVIGGGAAGLMCAIVAGRRGRRVLLLEHQDAVGKKIAISGGGRCNFTNLGAGPENYVSRQPDFCKSALARYSPWDFVALVEKHGIAFHEKKLGQQFCDGSARAIIEMLLAEATEAGVEVRTGCRVGAVAGTEKTSNIDEAKRFRIETNSGVPECESLVIATGGLSFPKLGATDLGYRVARDFGLRITETRPGLVPLTFSPEDMELHTLSGLSLPVAVRCGGATFRESLLITHRGVSGPAVLQISSFWRAGETVLVDLLPELRAADWLATVREEKADWPTLLSRHWPRRFAEAWCARHAPTKPLGHLKAREIADFAALLHGWPLRPAGTEGYAKAEVTLGGVETSELSSKTMEARKVPGLFFIGEVVDVTGWLGGYNFQWAWASGNAAGQAC